MENKHVIIIGAGISGLITARELAKRSFRVTILEAQNRAGGRIHTIYEGTEKLALETGAEFIHGRLPATFRLVDEYKLKVKKTGGRMINISSAPQDHGSHEWEVMLQKMVALETDLVFGEFLHTFFGDEKYTPLRNSAKQFAGGFDLADPATASTMALGKEWSKEEGDQFRIEDGYATLIVALRDDCINLGCALYTSEVAQEIEWKKNEVRVITENKNIFSSNIAVITASAGIMQLQSFEKKFIRFTPAIEEQINAFAQIGFGSVLKILLHFKKPFWNDNYKNAGFLFTGGLVPTWWTQVPQENNVLTAWVGGAALATLKEKNKGDITGAAMRSLADAFGFSIAQLNELLISAHTTDWGNDPYTRGGYSFSTIKTSEAKRKLNEGVEHVLFFAGEALDDTSVPGTVDAAICSGFTCAEKIISSMA